MTICGECGEKYMNWLPHTCKPIDNPAATQERILSDIDLIRKFGVDQAAVMAGSLLGRAAKRHKYMREIAPGVWVDVYDVIEAFGVTDGGMQHALKKILATGTRGHKDEAEDRKDILASVKRSNEIFNRRSKSE